MPCCDTFWKDHHGSCTRKQGGQEEATAVAQEMSESGLVKPGRRGGRDTGSTSGYSPKMDCSECTDRPDAGPEEKQCQRRLQGSWPEQIKQVLSVAGMEKSARGTGFEGENQELWLTR